MMNRLAQEKSPYLLQHANNPVDWYPWGEKAFAKARAEGKPIFLSIGYSTCHWCHVMERESFENVDVAKVLNQYFVSIKVDREERPDVDQVYMSVLQAMVGSGGWPMSLFLTPELQPFFAGTYFPPVRMHGRPSFFELIERIHELWETERDTLIESGEHITDALKSPVRPEAQTDLRDAVERTFHHFEQAFDRTEGGFGTAPKFPRPVQFDFLLNYYAAFGKERARDMALFTLRKMAMGGMHDQLGGGFHRYSVDRYWRASHFEKMLYDQALLLHAYLDAWQITQDSFFRDIAQDIVEYVLRDMTHPDGAFFSAEDADSEGEEGKFYLWTYYEIEKVLGGDAPAFAEYYGVTREGNFEHGTNVLYIAQQSLASVLSLPPLTAQLLAARLRRPRPLRDEKVLTSWNGLMLGAMARAGDLLEEPRFTKAAQRAGAFLWRTLRPQGQLFHRWRDADDHSLAEARFAANLDDFAFLIKGFLELYEATFDSIWLDRARKLQSEQDTTLFDTKDHAYFDAPEAPDLILRMKSENDGAEPSGNSVSAQNLFRLSVLTEENTYHARGEQILDYFAARVGPYPFAMPAMMANAFWKLRSPTQIILAGEDIASFKSIINSRFLPVSVTMRAESAVGPFAASLVPKDGKATAYVCHDYHCELPATTPEELERVLANTYRLAAIEGVSR